MESLTENQKGKGKRKRKGLGLVNTIGISIAVTYLVGTASAIAYTKWQSKQPQYLPIEAELLTPSGSVLKLEIADTPAEKERGLQYRSELPPNQGMLFVVDEPKQITFWMAGVNQPLDVVMIREGVVVGVLDNIPPCQLADFSNCPTYSTGVEIDQIIELPASQAEFLGIDQGIDTRITFLNKTN